MLIIFLKIQLKENYMIKHLILQQQLNNKIHLMINNIMDGNIMENIKDNGNNIQNKQHHNNFDMIHNRLEVHFGI